MCSVELTENRRSLTMEMRLVPRILERPSCPGYRASSDLWSSHTREQKEVYRMSPSLSPLCCSDGPGGMEEVKAWKLLRQTELLTRTGGE